MADHDHVDRAFKPGFEVESIDTPRDHQDDVVFKPTKTWKGYLWDTWELPQDQRRLLFKVDALVLTFASIGYFLKNLDQTNVNNAFLSGMQEDLGMYGNELVTSMSFPWYPSTQDL